MTTFHPMTLPGIAEPVGMIAPRIARPLAASGLLEPVQNGFRLVTETDPTAGLEAARGVLAAKGLIEPPRGEIMAVRASPDGAILARIDRSALRAFGLWTHKVHLNGLVRPRDGSVSVWLSRRAATARSNPGALDTLVAGGVPVGRSLNATLAAEAADEAGIGPELLQAATPAGVWAITYTVGPFLHREVLVARDLWLPPDFAPFCCDGEIEASFLFPWERFRDAVALGHGFKPNSLSVCRDLLARLGAHAE